MRILNTFSQMVLILSTFDMNWPKAADDTMEVSNTVMAAPQAAFNFDCLYIHPIFKGQRTYFIKCLVTACTPIAMFIIILIFWSIYAVIKKSTLKEQAWIKAR